MSQSTLTPPPTIPSAPPARRSAQPPTAHRPRRGLLLGANMRSAFESLRTNTSRSLLTMLGVIVGVGAVLVAVTLTQGASNLITQRISSLGSNTLFISPGSGNTRSGGGFSVRLGGGGGELGGVGATNSVKLSLTQADADAIALVPHVVAVTPILISNAQVVYSHNSASVNVEGVYPAELQIGSWSIGPGRWLTQSDENAAQPLAVLGSTTAADLFGDASSAVGKTIFLNGQAFNVVGVLQTKGSNQDDVVFIPFSTMRARLDNSQYVNAIDAQADDASNVTAAENAITTLLEQRHHIQSGQADDFRINSSNQIASAVQSNIGTLTLLLVGIAAISLVVGGIGIMNIMLVSVTERTREIGVRMALGARRGDIRNQFLIEAVTLSAVGGALGILIGLLIGWSLTSLVGLPFTISLQWTALAFAVAAAVGVVFGLYPAAQAARLDPIVALRTE